MLRAQVDDRRRMNAHMKFQSYAYLSTGSSSLSSFYSISPIFVLRHIAKNFVSVLKLISIVISITM